MAAHLSYFPQFGKSKGREAPLSPVVDTLKCNVASALDGLIKWYLHFFLPFPQVSWLLNQQWNYSRRFYLLVLVIVEYGYFKDNRQQQSHRHTHEIIKQILQTVHSRARKGHYCKSLDIAYGCELTWAQFRQYRDLLLSRKLLTSPDTKDFSHYKITYEGHRYLQLFSEIEDYLEPVVNT
jgi:predicted transcriptional regulator